MSEGSAQEPHGTRWSEAVDELNRETSRTARTRLVGAGSVGPREFLVEPLRAALGAFRAASKERLPAAVLAGYAALVRAAKAWEQERNWEEIQFLESPDGARWLVARGWLADVQPYLEGRDRGETIPGGRGGTIRLRTARGSLVVRQFRRGGAMRWMGTTYFGFRARPFREFWLLRGARSRGLPVPEPVAAGVRRRFGPFYWGAALVMIELTGAVPLESAIRSGPARSLLERLGPVLRKVHDAGLWHPDLNLGNVLVLPGGTFALVDLDRAHLGNRPLAERLRRRSLGRLRRSARRLDPDRRFVEPGDLDALAEAYAGRGQTPFH